MITRRQQLAKYAAEMRINPTPQERKLWYDFLASYPIPFRRQKVLGEYILDFYCRKVRISIELDGSQHFEDKNREYDEVRTIFLETKEIEELRFTNKEINENFEGVCEVIHNAVQKRRNDLHSLQFDLLKKK